MINIKEIEENDLDFLYKLRNDESVVKNCINQNKITYDEHKKWFLENIKNKNIFMYTINLYNQKIGQIKVELINGLGYIGYSIDKNYRGYGYGYIAIEFIKEIFKDIILVAIVKKDNIASIKIFEKSLFYKYEREEYFEFINKGSL